jgi:hypothetical protein
VLQARRWAKGDGRGYLGGRDTQPLASAVWVPADLPLTSTSTGDPGTNPHIGGKLLTTGPLAGRVVGRGAGLGAGLGAARAARGGAGGAAVGGGGAAAVGGGAARVVATGVVGGAAVVVAVGWVVGVARSVSDSSSARSPPPVATVA